MTAENENVKDTFHSTLSQLRKRCNEFDDLKQNVKDMNNVLKNDLFLNIGVYGVMLREKIDEFSSQIKENLKLSYKSINEKHAALLKRIDEVENEYQQKKIESSLNNLITDEFCESLSIQIAEIQQEFKDCDINRLFPNINYNISSKALMDSIAAMNIEITECESSHNFTISNLEKRLNKRISIGKTDIIDCIVTTGISDNGVFWIYNTDDQVNYIIDEISKCIRYHRLTDSTWLTMLESKREPIVGEKCFHLDSKNRKWMRVLVESYSSESGKIKVRYLDTSQQIEVSMKENSLIPWKDFDLNNIQMQAFKCCLFDKNVGIKYTYNVKFLFRDLINKKNFQCYFKDHLNDADEDSWLVDLNDYEELKKEVNNNYAPNSEAVQIGTINKEILNETTSKKAFMCEDIRLADKNQDKIKANYNVISTVENKIIESTSSFNLNKRDETINKPENIENVDCVVENIISNILNSIEQTSYDEENSIFKETSSVIEYLINEIEKEATNKENALITKEMSNLSSISHSYKCVNSDIRDQTDDVRLYTKRTGLGRVTSASNHDGIFWMCPSIENGCLYDANISDRLADYIKQNNWKSYLELNEMPNLGTKCFVRLRRSRNGEIVFRRGLVEMYISERREYVVRILDVGFIEFVESTSRLYPYVDVEGLDSKLRAIRCCIFPSERLKARHGSCGGISHEKQIAEQMRRISYENVHFNLVEQFEWKGLKYWYTELMTMNNVYVNKVVLDTIDYEEKRKNQNSRYNNSYYTREYEGKFKETNSRVDERSTRKANEQHVGRDYKLELIDQKSNQKPRNVSSNQSNNSNRKSNNSSNNFMPENNNNKNFKEFAYNQSSNSDPRLQVNNNNRYSTRPNMANSEISPNTMGQSKFNQKLNKSSKNNPKSTIQNMNQATAINRNFEEQSNIRANQNNHVNSNEHSFDKNHLIENFNQLQNQNQFYCNPPYDEYNTQRDHEKSRLNQTNKLIEEISYIQKIAEEPHFSSARNDLDNIRQHIANNVVQYEINENIQSRNIQAGNRSRSYHSGEHKNYNTQMNKNINESNAMYQHGNLRNYQSNYQHQNISPQQQRIRNDSNSLVYDCNSSENEVMLAKSNNNNNFKTNDGYRNSQQNQQQSRNIMKNLDSYTGYFRSDKILQQNSFPYQQEIPSETNSVFNDSTSSVNVEARQPRANLLKSHMQFTNDNASISNQTYSNRKQLKKKSPRNNKKKNAKMPQTQDNDFKEIQQPNTARDISEECASQGYNLYKQNQRNQQQQKKNEDPFPKHIE